MSKNHADYLTDEQIDAEIANLKDNIETEYAAQRAEREAWYNDPANNAEEMLERMAVVMELYKAREEAGLTQKELASRLGTKQSYVTALEHGRKNLTFSTLYRYARACGKRLKFEMI